MNILKNLAQSAKLSIALGYTDKFNQGAVTVNDNTITEIYNSMISAIKIESNEIDVVITRRNYVTDTIYQAYDPLTTNEYHVIVDNRVYICLSNNNNAISTVAPSGTLLNNIIKADGYVWAYIGDVQDIDIGKNTPFIKVPTKIYNTNEIGSIARIKQNTMVSTTTNFASYIPLYKVVGNGTGAMFDITVKGNGDLNYIACANGGFGYKDKDVILISDNFTGTGAVVNVHVTEGAVVLDNFTAGTGYTDCSILVIGDGTGAILDFATLNGSLTDVSVTDGGTNYTWAKAFVFSSEKAIVAELQPLMMNGKATDPSILLRANHWRINKTISTSLNTGYVYDGMEINLLSVIDQYENSVSGVKNTYIGTTPLIKATEIKEAHAVNKINTITVGTNRIDISLIIKI